MNIVILDGYVANSGDLSWEGLQRLGNLTVYDRTAPDQVVERCRNAECVFSNKVVLSADIIAQLPHLRFIGVLATGYNNIDIKAATAHEITVCNVPAYSTDSVAQQSFALLLHITNSTAAYADSVKEGKWSRCEDFSYRLSPLTELAGLTMGIIGMGNIGSRIAMIAKAFNMNVITTSGRKLPHGVTRVTLDELMSRSDVLSLNTALTEASYHIINEKTLGLMKPNAIIINTARGPLIDESALAAALRERRIAAVGLDVLTTEPPRQGSPLINAPNCYITPHIAWQSTQARRRLIEVSVSNLAAWLDGAPVNVVN